MLGTSVNICFLLAKLNDQLHTNIIMAYRTYTEVHPPFSVLLQAKFAPHPPPQSLPSFVLGGGGN